MEPTASVKGQSYIVTMHPIRFPSRDLTQIIVNGLVNLSPVTHPHLGDPKVNLTLAISLTLTLTSYNELTWG